MAVKQIKFQGFWTAWLVVFVAFIVFIAHVAWLLYWEKEESVDVVYRKRSLEDDGFIGFVSKGANDAKESVLHYLPADYVFLDYEYVIRSSSLSTFHRDVTSSLHFHRCKRPVYTLIVYQTAGDLLSVCPGSHRSWPFLWSSPVNISGPENTAILFDSEVVHAGQPASPGKQRLARQYKICHRDDVDRLGHLQGIHREAVQPSPQTSMFFPFYRTSSYAASHFINYWMGPWLMRKEDESTWSGWMQSFVPLQYYNNI